MNYKEIKSYEDACKVLGLKPLADEVFNAFPKAEREDVKAYHQLSVITKAINEGWEPDWTNRKERKFVPYMYTNSAGLAFADAFGAPSYASTYIGSRLCFPDYERAAYAVATFGELYEAYFRPGKWESSAEQEAATEAAGKEPENMEQDGVDGVIREEDDMTDAPDFLKKVVEICKSEIQPLAEADSDNRAIILIAVQDNAKYKDGDAGFGTYVAVVGSENNLSRGLANFLKQERTKPIIKKAILRNKL